MKKMKKQEKPQEQRQFSLRAIYLREGLQWISDSFDPSLPGQGLSGQFRISGHQMEVQEAIENVPNAIPIKTFRVTSSFEFRYLNIPEDEQIDVEDESKHLVAKISARITVDYLIETPDTPPKEKLEKWASSNALLHTWPYWREFCHSTLLRMSLPVIVMPMMDVTTTKE